MLETMLRSNIQNQEQLLSSEGFKIIGFLLEKISSQCWTSAAVLYLDKLALAVSTMGNDTLVCCPRPPLVWSSLYISIVVYPPLGAVVEVWFVDKRSL